MNKPQQQAFDRFVGLGWTPPQAAGLVANLWAESSLNPAAVGDGGQAYGIAQWHPDRQAGFRAVLGHDIRGSSLDDQLFYVHAELQSTEKAAGDALRVCTSAAEAGAVVSKRYERPADTEGEARKRAQLAENILSGATSAATAPASTPPVVTQQGRKTMPAALAILMQFAPALSALIPQIAGLFKPESEVAKRNVGLAQVLLDTITQAAGTATLDASDTAKMAQAVDNMQTDPAVKKAVQEAIVTQPEVMAGLQITEIGGGIAAARDADLKARAEPAFWRSSAVFWMSVILVPMVYLYVMSSIAGGMKIPEDWPWYAQLPLKLLGSKWDDGARVGLANLIVGLVLGGICGVYFGVSVTQQKQQQQAQEKTTTTA